MRFIKMIRLILRLILFLLIFPVTALSVETDVIPPELEHWRSWVLHGLEDRFCPTAFDNGDVYQCIWPARLELDLQENQGSFTQQWLIFSKNWVPLPGGEGFWPKEVHVDGEPAVVVGRDSIPTVYLTPGTHRVHGSFSWEEMPEMIQAPPESGLLALTIGGAPVHLPVIDKDGRLWLKKKQEIRREEDVIELRIYRLLKDSIPMQVTNLLRLNISGRAREIRLKEVLLEKSVVMKLDSPLPTRIGKNGDLLIQGRPGRWEITILSRQQGPVRILKASRAVQGQEFWAFQSQNHLRMVNIKGIPAVDPKQTDVPENWRQYPTFILKPGAEMTFAEIRRGDPDPAPDQLNLKRIWWLDFDGRGFTIQDHISGRMSRHWYLAMNPPGELGRVAVDGIDQLITHNGSNVKPGVELRKGQLALVAEARLEGGRRSIPAVGWDHGFQSVSGMLNLPPGWRLLSAGGVDVVSGTWIERWSLLDLFVVIIIAMAVWKLWNGWWGLLALFTLTLTYHEPGAPRLVWLNLLAAMTLIRFLPEGWVKKLANIWRWAAVVTLLVLAIPFMVQQVRWGIYPQLEWPRQGPTSLLPIGAMAKRSVVTEEPPALQEFEQPTAEDVMASAPAKSRRKTAVLQRQTVLAQDPNVLVQTGPGLPVWRWRTIALRWNGPVAKNQQIRLWLVSPTVNFALALLRVGLLAGLILVLMDFRQWKLPRARSIASAGMIVLFAMIGPAAVQVNAEGYPPPQLLDQLKQRLLEKPDCLPHCADSPRMHLTAGADQLQILFSIHAAVDTAVPLPGSLKAWSPAQVLIDNQPARGLLRDHEGRLWVQLAKGTHVITLLGVTPPVNSFQIPLPLRPRRVTVESQAWAIEGVGKDGQVAASIRLTSLKKDKAIRSATDDATLAPFFQIERVLSLGLNWQVITTVKRLTPTGTPAMLSVPLLDGESVTTAGIQVENRSAQITLDAKMTEMRWFSSLKQSDTIHLKAPASVSWSETWILDASPIWHCDLAGIDVIHHQDQTGYWRPRWQPWPGESVTVNITRPKAVAGQFVTVDQAKLDVTPGKRYTKAELVLKIRTSKGGQHQVGLPESANLTAVAINGKSQPIRQKAKQVTVPLKPGGQTVRIDWHQDASDTMVTRGPAVDIGAKAVNADVTFHMPHNRWILWNAGPRWGPAVLFWTYLAVVILAAAGLGRITWTPLKTYHWFLLSLGLTQVHVFLAILVIGWLLALGLRRKRPPTGGAFIFNLSQLALVFWTAVALVCLYLAIQGGLLGIPNMQISGNGSSSFLLHWTQDRIGPDMPQPWVLTVPMWVFRVLMLLWALWLAYSLLKWLRWGWQCFNEKGLWKKIIRSRKKQPPIPPPLPSKRKEQASEAQP